MNAEQKIELQVRVGSLVRAYDTFRGCDGLGIVVKRVVGAAGGGVRWWVFWDSGMRDTVRAFEVWDVLEP